METANVTRGCCCKCKRDGAAPDVTGEKGGLQMNTVEWLVMWKVMVVNRQSG